MTEPRYITLEKLQEMIEKEGLGITRPPQTTGFYEWNIDMGVNRYALNVRLKCNQAYVSASLARRAAKTWFGRLGLKEVPDGD